jgi:formate C-acetyltransferase
MEAFRAQMKHFVHLRVAGEHVIDAAIEELVPEPFCTGLVQDCLHRGKTPKEGGSVYDFVTGPETGVTNAANSLAAIRELVFDRKALTAADLAAALGGNFAGAEGEQVRQMLINKAPKFGNDVDSVDGLAAEVYTIFIRELEMYRTPRAGRGPIGCISYPCTATISANVPSGICVGASADGRRAGEPLAEGCSPFHGTDLRGPTAVINSVAKMPTMLITGGNLLNQKIHPGCLATAEGRAKLAALVQTLFEKNGWHIQFNVVSTQTLRVAQRAPQEYRDLVVRVAGYSALFNNLEPATQEDIIARTEHVV